MIANGIWRALWPDAVRVSRIRASGTFGHRGPILRISKLSASPLPNRPMRVAEDLAYVCRRGGDCCGDSGYGECLWAGLQLVSSRLSPISPASPRIDV